VTDFQFQHEQMSQHIMKLAVELAPGVVLDQNRPALQSFANALIREFPEVFETLVSGPQDFRVNKTFALGQGKADIATLVWTQRGPVLTVPKRLFVSGSHEIIGADPERIFQLALQELGERFADRAIPRVSVAHNLVFDTGDVNSMQIMAAYFSRLGGQGDLTHARIQLQTEIEGRGIAFDIRPTYVSPAGRSAWPAPDDARFGMIVNLEIAAGDPPDSVTQETADGLLAFTDRFVADGLLSFLNGN
jgi:hypothetical protein